MMCSGRKYVAVLMCLAAGAIAWGAGGIERNMRAGFRMDEKASIQDWNEEVARLSEERLALIDDLKRSLSGERDLEKQGRLCFLLGEYRADSAVQDLCECMTLELHRSEEYKRLPLWGQFPAWEALVKIGVPATAAVIDKLAGNDDLLTRFLCVEFLRSVYGDEIGALLVEKAIEKEGDPRRKGNLEAGRGLPRIHRESLPDE